MRPALWLVLLELIIGLGCASEIDRPSHGDAVSDPDGEVGRAESALSQCGLRGRRPTSDGFVESLLCSGVACTRTCGLVNGTLLCSTKCEVSSQAPAFVALDLSILRPECRVDPNSRVNAGSPLSTQANCEGSGACWDNRTRDPKFPWCYEPLGKQPTCGGVEPVANAGARINAGFPGITPDACVRGRGACFDNRIRNVNWCYLPMVSTQEIVSDGTPPIDPGTPGGDCSVVVGPNPLVLTSMPTPAGYFFDQGFQGGVPSPLSDPSCLVGLAGFGADAPLEIFPASPSPSKAALVFVRDNFARDPFSPCAGAIFSGQVCSVSGTVGYNALDSGLNVRSTSIGRIDLVIFP